MNLSYIFRNRPRVFETLHRFSVIPAFSQTSETERACLAKHASQLKSAVEIGTFMGVTAAVIAKVLSPDGFLYCVDPYDQGESIMKIAHRHIERANVSSKVKWIRTFSQDAKPHLPKTVDFMFVDGDHSYEGLKRDWAIVQDLLGPGGIVCFHDTSIPKSSSHSYCGAEEYFNEHIRNAPGFAYVETVETLNVMRRLT
jgi:predicted O-methyltransferase YrrM